MSDESKKVLDRLLNPGTRKDKNWIANQDLYTTATPRMRHDIFGKRFHLFICIRPAGHDKRRRLLVECKCDCGVIFVTRADRVYTGKQKSCGCQQSMTSDSIKNEQKSFINKFFAANSRSNKRKLGD